MQLLHTRDSAMLQQTGKRRPTARHSLFDAYYNDSDDDEYGWDEDTFDEEGSNFVDHVPGPIAPDTAPNSSSKPAKKKPKTKYAQAAVQTATEAVRAVLAAAGMQLDAPPPVRSVRTLKAAKMTAEAVASIQREGDSRGFAFFGGSMLIAHKIFMQVPCSHLYAGSFIL